MPGFPQPHEMRNWKEVARKYDSLVFGQSLLPDQTGYNFKGKLDKVKIYNYGIQYEEIKNMYEQ